MADPLAQRQASWVERVIIVVLFAVAFGYLEAAVVAALRLVYDPIRASVYPDLPPEALLPLVTLDQLRASGPGIIRQVYIELGREAATMIMLMTTATLAARRRGDWIAMFMIAFGVWDIVYYISLKPMVGFPESLLTWDILFLLPVPWLGPVLAPILVSVSMIGAGLIVLSETGRGYPLRARWFHWTGIVTGGLIIIWSFCRDYLQTPPGQVPEHYSWLIFFAGEALGLTTFAHAIVKGRRNLVEGTSASSHPRAGE